MDRWYFTQMSPPDEDGKRTYMSRQLCEADARIEIADAIRIMPETASFVHKFAFPEGLRMIAAYHPESISQDRVECAWKDEQQIREAVRQAFRG